MSQLDLRVVVPPPEAKANPEVRPFVDGRDLLTDADFNEGPGTDPSLLLRAGGPLTATAEPHEVRLATAECVEECCGAIYVTVRRDGDHVVWDSWRNPVDELSLPEFRFDADAYHREVDRAATDLSWEWPARAVARLLEQRLIGHPTWPARWDCELTTVSAWPWQPNQITVFLFHRDAVAVTQYRVELAITGDDPAAQAEQLAGRLTAGDPRPQGEVCGGWPALDSP